MIISSKRIAGVAAAILSLMAGRAGASLIIDQQQSIQQSGGSANYSIGQSFTPTATLMDTAGFTLRSEGTTVLQLAILTAASGSVDQQQTTQQSGGSANYSIGQSFTPTGNLMDMVQFTLRSEGSTVVRVAILDGLVGNNGLGGTVLATSAPVTLSNGALAPVNFQLASPLSVIPGHTYVAEVIYESGSYFNWAQASNLYAGGQMLQAAYPAAGGPGLDQQDFVFRQGLNFANTNGLGGTVLGTSAPVTLSNATLAPIDFQLTSPLSLDPGQTYVAELIYLSGAYFNWAQTSSDLYAGGQMFQAVYPAKGGPRLDLQDFVFREGLNAVVMAVPEPPTIALVFACIAILILGGYGRRRGVS